VIGEPGKGLDAYLAELEAGLDESKANSGLLWPRTPLDGAEYQARISQRVGVSDVAVDDPHSRPNRIVRLVACLRDAGIMPAAFSLVDIACGDGRILLELKHRFPESSCFGVDLNAGVFPAHREAEAAGVVMRRVLIQDLFAVPPPRQFDLALMLNTYRGWENADLPEDDRDLPRIADEWLGANARLIVLTATADQLPPWRERGFAVTDFGPGEDDSRLVLVSREPLPLRLRVAALISRRRG
jgi:SAM-dependent methyltransferase